MIRPRGYQAVNRRSRDRENMRVLHEDLRWRVIYHQHLYGSSKKETANCLFTSTAFVSKICRLYRRYGDVSRQGKYILTSQSKRKTKQQKNSASWLSKDAKTLKCRQCIPYSRKLTLHEINTNFKKFALI